LFSGRFDLSMKATERGALFASSSIVAVGLIASVLIISSAELKSDLSGEYYTQLVQIGVGAEDNNDLALKIALGPKDGDVSADVTKESEAAVAKARDETSKAADDEISAALTKAETEGKGKMI
jgi:hypothetical protein